MFTVIVSYRVWSHDLEESVTINSLDELPQALADLANYITNECGRDIEDIEEDLKIIGIYQKVSVDVDVSKALKEANDIYDKMLEKEREQQRKMLEKQQKAEYERLKKLYDK
jgi:hypothetical protein